MIEPTEPSQTSTTGRQGALIIVAMMTVVIVSMLGHGIWRGKMLSISTFALPLFALLSSGLPLLFPNADQKAITTWCLCMIGGLLLIDWHQSSSSALLLLSGISVFGSALVYAVVSRD